MAKLFVSLLVLGLAGLATANYCNVSKDHTMCTYTSTKPASACTNYKFTALTAADKTAILNAHNELRNKVALGQETLGITKQPSASNMRKLTWDNELAAIAQRWANQCNFAHDINRDTADATYSGQNLFWEASSAPLGAVKWSKPVQDWYNEVKDHDGAKNTAAFTVTTGPVIGHYTQVVWGDTAKVGCGYADYTTVQSGRNWYARIVVCNYKVGGNLINAPMYKVGSPASACPSGTKQDSTYKGLCA